MSLRDVYEGRLAWSEYLRQQMHIGALLPQSEETSVKLLLDESDYQTSQEAGLGAIQTQPPIPDKDHLRALELDLATLANGIAQLHADFTPLLGDLTWRVQLQNAATIDLLSEVRLAEFEREARAFRTRAERAYQNGWYEEALQDFLNAEARNYPDYGVLRSIAQLYLFHLINLPCALEYFNKAAKYARPYNAQQAAEAHYFAALVHLLQQNPVEAKLQLEEASSLLPEFAEAHYQLAGVAVSLQQFGEAIASLEKAIAGDARYYERAKTDAVFDLVRPEVNELLARLVLPVQAQVEKVRSDAAQLQGYVIAESEKEKLDGAIRTLEQPSSTYREQLQKLDQIKTLQNELEHIHERFDKHYAIDPRDYVRSIAFSHSGHILAAGFLYGGIQLWEVDSMQKLFAFGGHYASVNSVAFSPNDLILVTGSRDRDIKLWETDSAKEIQKLRGHTAEVRAVSFSPDGQWLVSGSHDTTIRLWRAATGHEVETFHGHTRAVTSVVFSPDGRLLASGSWDHTIRIWDLQTGQTINILRGHRIGIASLTISHDGRWLASGSEKGEVKLWDLATGAEIRSFTGLRNSVTSVAFSPDSTLLAAGSLGVRIMVWRCDSANVVRQLEYENISYNSVAFSPRGQWLAFGNRDLQLWLKAILTEEEYAAMKAGHERALQAAKYSSIRSY